MPITIASGITAVSADLTNPGPIGSVTPSTGAFTTVTASTPIAISSGGTGAATAGAALTALGAVNKAGDSMTGPLLQANGTVAAPSYGFSSFPNTGFYYNGGIVASNSGLNTQIFGTAGFAIASNVWMGWNATTDVTGGTYDLRLYRDAANTLAQRNGTNAQTFKIANTYTDASNNEYGVIDWTVAANILTIGAKAAGTGTQRVVNFDAAQYAFMTGGVSAVRLTSVALFPTANGVTDLGFATLGWKRLYIDYTNSGTVGNVTINKAAGRVNLAAGGTTLTLTNSLITAASKIFLQAINSSGNAVAVEFYPVPGAGSATINAFPAVTNQTAIDFFIVNAD